MMGSSCWALLPITKIYDMSTGLKTLLNTYYDEE